MFDFQCLIFDSAICILLSCMLNLYWLKITKLVNNLGRNFTKKSQSPNMWWACYLSCIPDPFLKFFIIYFREAQIIVGRKCTTFYLKLACILLKVPWHLRLHMKYYVEDFSLKHLLLLGYAHVRYVKSLFTNIQKQKNVSVLF